MRKKNLAYRQACLMKVSLTLEKQKVQSFCIVQLYNYYHHKQVQMNYVSRRVGHIIQVAYLQLVHQWANLDQRGREPNQTVTLNVVCTSAYNINFPRDTQIHVNNNLQ